MDIKTLSKKLDKAYWRDGQKIWIASMEVIQDNDGGPYSIYSVSPKTEWHEYFLFDLQTYDALWEWDYGIRPNILNPKYRQPTKRYDVYKASCSPFYHAGDRIFTIPKFSKVTEEDILFCTRWFFRNVTDCWCLFNINMYKFKDDKQLENNKD
jgi:hypothetical protein